MLCFLFLMQNKRQKGELLSAWSRRHCSWCGRFLTRKCGQSEGSSKNGLSINSPIKVSIFYFKIRIRVPRGRFLVIRSLSVFSFFFGKQRFFLPVYVLVSKPAVIFPRCSFRGIAQPARAGTRGFPTK